MLPPRTAFALGAQSRECSGSSFIAGRGRGLELKTVLSGGVRQRLHSAVKCKSAAVQAHSIDVALKAQLRQPLAHQLRGLDVPILPLRHRPDAGALCRHGRQRVAFRVINHLQARPRGCPGMRGPRAPRREEAGDAGQPTRGHPTNPSPCSSRGGGCRADQPLAQHRSAAAGSHPTARPRHLPGRRCGCMIERRPAWAGQGCLPPTNGSRAGAHHAVAERTPTVTVVARRSSARGAPSTHPPTLLRFRRQGFKTQPPCSHPAACLGYPSPYLAPELCMADQPRISSRLLLCFDVKARRKPWEAGCGGCQTCLRLPGNWVPACPQPQWTRALSHAVAYT